MKPKKIQLDPVEMSNLSSRTTVQDTNHNLNYGKGCKSVQT